MIAGRDDLIPIPFDPDEDRDEWLESRRGGLGGSDIAAVVGESRTKRPIDVFNEKTTGLRFGGDGDAIERMDMGNLLETIVGGLFAAGPPRWPRKGGPYVLVKPPSVCHRDRLWQRGATDAMLFLPESLPALSLVAGREVSEGAYLDSGCSERLATLDLYDTLVAQQPTALWECKTHGWFGSRGYRLDDEDRPLISVPPDKRLQCAWYLALFQVEVCYLAALVDTHLRRTFAIQRDLELEEMLLEAGDRFWHQHVLADVPPPPDGSESYRKHLAKRFDKHGADLIESTDEVDLAVEALIAIKRDEKRLKDEREMLEQTIKTHVGHALGVKTAFGPVTWKSQPSGKLRQKEALEELYKVAGWTDEEIEAFEARYQQADHRVLRIPK